ncbi:hypothetical protein D3C76_894090 [compost metagenome]
MYWDHTIYTRLPAQPTVQAVAPSYSLAAQQPQLMLAYQAEGPVLRLEMYSSRHKPAI